MSFPQVPAAWERLGARIRAERERQGMSRKSLADRAGVSIGSVQAAEKGAMPRGRWPQSLSAIEKALRWDPDSMRSILEGGDPLPALELFSMDDDEPRPDVDEWGPMLPSAGWRRLEELAHEQEREFPGPETFGYALAQFPVPLRKALPDVLDFGRKAVSHGADPEAVERYEEALEGLLMDMVGRRLAYEGSPPSDPGSLWRWRDALRRDPVLRKEKEELARALNRERRRIREAAEREYLFSRVPRTTVVGEQESTEILKEVRKLAEEVARLSKKVDRQDVPTADDPEGIPDRS